MEALSEVCRTTVEIFSDSTSLPLGRARTVSSRVLACSHPCFGQKTPLQVAMTAKIRSNESPWMFAQSGGLMPQPLFERDSTPQRRGRLRYQEDHEAASDAGQTARSRRKSLVKIAGCRMVWTTIRTDMVFVKLVRIRATRHVTIETVNIMKSEIQSES